jgi:hypothetical protein
VTEEQEGEHLEITAGTFRVLSNSIALNNLISLIISKQARLAGTFTSVHDTFVLALNKVNQIH